MRPDIAPGGTFPDNRYWFRGRPSVHGLWHDLRAVTRAARSVGP